MGLKDLIFESKEGKKPKQLFPSNDSDNKFKSKFDSDSTKSTGFSFPNLDTSTPVSTPMFKTKAPLSCEPYIETIVKMYENGFDGLNQQGYDFYEYYKAVIESGIDVEAVYKMAFKMGNAMGGNIGKDVLLNQAQFYINKLEEVHEGYKQNGEALKINIFNEKSSKESSLRADINNIDSEINRLKTLKSSKESELSSIDTEYTPKLSELECKLEANDVAKNKLVSSITIVVEGIKKFI